jgi:hypothetical protein
MTAFMDSGQSMIRVAAQDATGTSLIDNEVLHRVMRAVR